MVEHSGMSADDMFGDPSTPAPADPQAPPVALQNPPHAWLDVLAERQRQIEAEGWTPEHDDTHDGGEIARAASCYAAAAGTAPDVRRDIEARASLPDELWPWPMDWWKPTTRRRDLVKAAALALAEIERLDRLEAANG